MLDQAVFKRLKQVDVTRDIEKTKQRVRETWSNLEKSKRNEMFNLSGLKKYSVERSYKNGNISVKLAAALSQAAGADPFYLIGATDEPQEATEALLIQFLKEFGYEDVINTLPKPKRSYTRRAKPEIVEEVAEILELETDEDVEDEDEDEDDDETEFLIDEPEMVLTILAEELSNILSDEQRAAFDNMTENEVIELVKSLLLRNRYNNAFSALTYLVKYIITQ